MFLHSSKWLFQSPDITWMRNAASQWTDSTFWDFKNCQPGWLSMQKAQHTVLFAEKPENTQFSFSKFSNLESSSYHLSPSTWQQLEWISGCTAVENGGRSSFPRRVSECPLFTSGHLLWAVTWGLHRGSRWHINSWMANWKYPHPLTPAPPSYPLSPKLIDRRNQLIKIRPACDCLCFGIVGTWWLPKKQKTYRAR